jgi:hypothetical protein
MLPKCYAKFHSVIFRKTLISQNDIRLCRKLLVFLVFGFVQISIIKDLCEKLEPNAWIVVQKREH